jgi:endonuclease III
VIFDLSIRIINTYKLLNTIMNYNEITINDIIDVVRLYVTHASTLVKTVRHLIAYYKKTF